MTIAKRGARVALNKVRQIAAPSARNVISAADPGPLGGNEPPGLWEEGSYASLGRDFGSSLDAGGAPVAAGGG